MSNAKLVIATFAIFTHITYLQHLHSFATQTHTVKVPRTQTQGDDSNVSKILKNTAIQTDSSARPVGALKGRIDVDKIKLKKIGKVNKDYVTKESLSELIKQQNAKIGGKNGPETIPPRILNLPELPSGTTYVYINKDKAGLPILGTEGFEMAGSASSPPQ